MDREVIHFSAPRGPLRRPFALAFALLFPACIEKPDPASQAAAILHKHPSSFLDKTVSLDALADRELGLGTRPILAESLHAFATRLRPALATASGDSAQIEVLNRFLFDTLGIEPVLSDMGLASSLPSRVILDRKGSCVGLVLLYLALADQLDLPAAPLFLPGHLALRFGDGRAGRSVETLRRGIARSDSFYRETFSLDRRPWYTLAPAPREAALGALLFNLANLHRARGHADWAAWEYRLALELVPGWPEAAGSLGGIHLEAGRLDSAGLYLKASQAGDSAAAPIAKNLELLDRARGAVPVTP
jgi:regulator of sirC expression with transglutaminase-like and TPR domain